jgi:oxygen tolerance protein BatD
MSRFRILLVSSYGFLAIWAGVEKACAASPSITAVLSNSEARVGQMVQLEIRLTDAGNAAVPGDIPVDGLEIRQTGTSRQFEMRNFTTSSSVTYTYTVLPLKEGTFKIPPQTIQVNGNSLRTPELTLRVNASAGQSGPNVAGTSNPNSARLAYAELIVPKKTAYVGEMIPVVLRIASAVRVLALEPPNIASQGFTAQKIQGEEQPSVEVINGKKWQVYSFKTAIAAIRPGKFELGPVHIKASLAVPVSRDRTLRPRSPFDIFNNDDPFSDPFFNDPFGRFSEKREVEISSEAVPLEVKALPPNPPASFSGAIGNFALKSEAKPKTVQVGDPITVTSTISGRGNFDRVNAPVLEDDHGWHKYPPSAKFKQDDEVGISGEKTFEAVLSPNEKKNAIPPLLFVYFDPVKEKYVSLRTDPTSIQVEGGATTAAAATPSQAASSSAVPPTSAQPTPKPADILYQLAERPAHPQSFTPLYQRRDFWLIQIIPLLVLMSLIGWRIRQARLQNREAQRIAGLHHEVSELMRKLRRSDVSPTDYFPQASRVVQLKTALARNVDPNGVDMESAARAFDLDEVERDQLRQLFETSDELRYSGAGNGNRTISPERRREVLHLIESLQP